MKKYFQNTLTYFLVPILLQMVTFGWVEPAEADPLMNREGKTLRVSINGQSTKGIKPLDLIDSEGTNAYTVHWEASPAKGPLCFRLEPLDPRLGKAERIDILIFEIKEDRPNQRWKSYDLVPSTTAGLADFQTEKGFCPTEYTLTERLRYPSLPAGKYLFRIAYWGVGNWDRQDILFTVKE